MTPCFVISALYPKQNVNMLEDPTRVQAATNKFSGCWMNKKSLTPCKSSQLAVRERQGRRIGPGY